MKLLCTGDLHIGRCSTCVPEMGVSGSCASAWKRVVDSALQEEVDAVLLSGDLVNANSRFFEAIGPLERGLDRLADADIQTFAVAGNHDYSVLPELQRSIKHDHLHVLGVGGSWECREFSRDGEKLNIVGWSFPGPHVSRNPLHDLPPDLAGTPAVGILHCDLHNPNSIYAPVSLADLLRQAGFPLWLLGHIHIPKRCEQTPVVLYPGSPQAMDPGETGDHGPWIVQLSGGHVQDVRQLKTSTVKYLPINVDLTGATIDDARGRLIEDIREQATISPEEESCLEVISCRVTVTGQVGCHSSLPDLQQEFQKHSEERLYVDRILCEMSPTLDIRSIAEGKGAAATAAKILLSIEDRSFATEHPDLIQSAEDRLRDFYAANAYSSISFTSTECSEDRPADREKAIHLVKTQCAKLLAELVEGKGK